MIYLSQLILNPRHPDVRRGLSDSYRLHQSFARAFGDSQEAARVLFRVDESEGRIIALVQSQIEPEWSTLAAGYCRYEPAVKAIDPTPPVDGIWAFRLRANPTKADSSLRVEKRNRGKRVGIYREEERLAWIERQAERAGFRILQVNIHDEGRSVPKRRDDGQQYFLMQVQSREKNASFSAAQFDGLLQVVDTQKLKEALENGIGRGKAFGFGLLSLRRA